MSSDRETNQSSGSGRASNHLTSNRLPSNRWIVLTVVALVVFVGQSSARFTFGLLLPAMKTDLRVSYGLAGWLGTINLAGYLVGTIIVSVAALKLPAHRIMQIGVLLCTVGIGILVVAHDVWLLLFAMALSGVGGAASWIPAPVIAANAFPVNRRALAMGSTSGMIGFGIVIASVLTRVLRAVTANPLLWRTIWFVEAGVGVVATVLALRVLRPLTNPAGPSGPPKISVLKRVPRWWAPTIAYMFFGLGYVLFATFVVSALEADAGFSKSHAANVYAIMGIGNAIGALLVGRIADRIGQRLALGASFLLAALGCASVLVGAEPLVTVAAFGFGFGMAGSVVSITSYLGRTLAPHHFSSAFGVVTACFGVVQTFGPRLGGWIADKHGSFEMVFVLATACWVLGSSMSLAMPRRAALASHKPAA